MSTVCSYFKSDFQYLSVFRVYPTQGFYPIQIIHFLTSNKPHPFCYEGGVSNCRRWEYITTRTAFTTTTRWGNNKTENKNTKVRTLLSSDSKMLNWRGLLLQIWFKFYRIKIKFACQRNICFQTGNEIYQFLDRYRNISVFRKYISPCSQVIKNKIKLYTTLTLWKTV